MKEGRVDTDGEIRAEPHDGALALSYKRGTVNRGIEIHCTPKPGSIGDDTIAFEAIVPQHGEWTACFEVHPVLEGNARSSAIPLRPARRARHARREARAVASKVPQVESDDDELKRALDRSAEDLGALRIFDPDFPERVVVAAGAPWFMTVFGRDSLITSWMALIVDPDLALGVLQTLARFQGNEIDPRTDEQPGRILHEMRFGEAASLSLGGGSIYYGTADATPLFVMLLGELRRWGIAAEAVDSLLPNAERALEWIETYGDADGDGYVECKRATDRGLVNQGWKDSWDAIRYSDGSIAQAPIALCEVQAYVYSAYLARAHFAHEHGDEATYDAIPRQGRRLKSPSTGISGSRTRVVRRRSRPRQAPDRSFTSNIGHCLWTGIVDDDKAHVVAKRLVSPEMFSGWGDTDPRDLDGRLQPRQLSLRIRLAPRHRDRRRRARPLRLQRRRPADRAGASRRRPDTPAVDFPSSSAASTAPSSHVPCPTRPPARLRPGRPHHPFSACG